MNFPKADHELTDTEIDERFGPLTTEWLAVLQDPHELADFVERIVDRHPVRGPRQRQERAAREAEAKDRDRAQRLTGQRFEYGEALTRQWRAEWESDQAKVRAAEKAAERRKNPVFCVFEGCGRTVHNVSRGLCHTHTQQARRGKELTPIGLSRPIRLCEVEGCESVPVTPSSLRCETHRELMRQRRVEERERKQAERAAERAAEQARKAAEREAARQRRTAEREEERVRKAAERAARSAAWVAERAARPCSEAGCDRTVHCRDMCQRHYAIWYRNQQQPDRADIAARTVAVRERLKSLHAAEREAERRLKALDREEKRRLELLDREEKRRLKALERVAEVIPRICSMEGCEAKSRARGLCQRHYDRTRYVRAPKRNTGPCDFEGCDRPTTARGLCNRHYRQCLAGKPLTPFEPRQRSCGRDGCEGKHFSKGLCKPHYEQQRKANLPPCVFEGCENHQVTRGYCSGHASQLARGNPLQPLRTRKEDCDFDGCNRPHSTGGLCASHYAQKRRGAPLSPLPAREYEPCAEAGCERPAEVRRRCATHYMRINRSEHRAQE